MAARSRQRTGSRAAHGLGKSGGNSSTYEWTMASTPTRNASGNEVRAAAISRFPPNSCGAVCGASGLLPVAGREGDLADGERAEGFESGEFVALHAGADGGDGGWTFR